MTILFQFSLVGFSSACLIKSVKFIVNKWPLCGQWVLSQSMNLSAQKKAIQLGQFWSDF